jgi:hypothetical protein
MRARSAKANGLVSNSIPWSRRALRMRCVSAATRLTLAYAVVGNCWTFCMRRKARLLWITSSLPLMQASNLLSDLICEISPARKRAGLDQFNTPIFQMGSGQCIRWDLADPT